MKKIILVIVLLFFLLAGLWSANHLRGLIFDRAPPEDVFGIRHIDPIPLPHRTAKIKEGDWFLFELNGERGRSIVTKIEHVNDDTFIHYRYEKIGDDGGIISEKEHTLSHAERAKSIEALASSMRERGAAREKKVVNIGGKAVNVVVVVERGSTTWFSDEVSIDGVVMLEVPEAAIFGTNEKMRIDMIPIDFGGSE